MYRVRAIAIFSPSRPVQSERTVRSSAHDDVPRVRRSNAHGIRLASPQCAGKRCVRRARAYEFVDQTGSMVVRAAIRTALTKLKAMRPTAQTTPMAYGLLHRPYAIARPHPVRACPGAEQSSAVTRSWISSARHLRRFRCRATLQPESNSWHARQAEAFTPMGRLARNRSHAHKLS